MFRVGAITLLLVCVFALPALFAQPPPTTAEVPLQNALKIAVWPSSGPVVAFNGGNLAHSAFELYITNYSTQPIRIAALDIRGTGNSSYTKKIDRNALKASFLNVALAHTANPEPVLAAGQAGLFFVFLNFHAIDSLPMSVNCTLEAEVEGNSKSLQRVASVTIPIRRDPSIIDSPLSGDNWIAANGPSNTSAHRRAVIVLGGRPRIPERFAIDFVRFGTDGKTYSGDEHRNESYHCYGVPVRAVADGQIASVTDGIPENVPNSGKMATTLTVESLAGNNVVEQIGPAVYAGYAHMIPGSLKVSRGDHVHTGDVLGLLGNSGNSTEPHLHFQLCDGPTFLECDGLPQEFRRFTLKKYQIKKRTAGQQTLAVNKVSTETDQSPLEDDLVDFPAAH